MGEDSGFLEDSLASIKDSIAKNPNSHETREFVQKTLDAVLEGTQAVGTFTPRDFTNLMHTAIIAVGYTRGGVTNIHILTELAASVPSQLGVESLFPEVREDGRRGLWLVGSIVMEASTYAQVMGDGYALHILGQCGRYAYLVAGVFPDMLLANERKKGVDVQYFEMWGAAAFNMASRHTARSGVDAREVFREFAANFSGYRRMLNVAGGLVGTPARRTVEKEIVESYLNRGHSNSVRGEKASNANGTNKAFGLPRYDPQATSPWLGFN